MANIFNSNPELKRNIWLEMQSNRLLIMPFVITLIYVFFFFTAGAENLAEVFIYPSLVIYGILVFIWGNRQASEAVISEVNDETWSFQRMTSIGPWQMAIGKLFGSTIYTWYGAAYPILVYIICAISLPDTLVKLKLLVHLILVGILSHSLCIALSLIGIRKNAGKSRIKSTFYFIVALIFSGSMASRSIGLFIGDEVPIMWFGMEIDFANVIMMTLLFYVFWAVIGLYRTMRTELQFESKPWVWLAFMLSIMLHHSGFMYETEYLELKHKVVIGGYIALAISLALTYFMVFSEPKDVISFRRIIDRWKKRDWDGFLYNIPLWLVSYVVAVIAGIVLFIYVEGAPMSESIGRRIADELFPVNYPFIPINFILFMTRDVAILLFLNLSDNKKRADMTALLYLVVLYGLIPGIMIVSDLDGIVAAFWPTYKGATIINSTVLITIQAIVALIMLGNRWGVKNSELSAKYDELT